MTTISFHYVCTPELCKVNVKALDKNPHGSLSSFLNLL